MGVEAPANPETRPAWMLLGGVLLLFTLWSCSFIAIEYLLRDVEGKVRFDWLSLTVARFVPVGAFCALYLALFRARKTMAALKSHGKRAACAGLFNVMGYNFALYYAQQAGVAAPIASLMTALAPLFLMLLSAAFLSERITRRRVLGFMIAMSGIIVISQAKPEGGATYVGLIVIAALAPLSWSVYSVLTKPVAGKVDPVVWTFLVLVFGSLPLVPLLPWSGIPHLRALDGEGWLALGYLSVLSTIVGFALWTWLLKYLPATTVGFTVFLNPPMTTSYKALFAWLVPSAFVFTISGLEWGGGALALVGVAVAIWRR
ncbi:MAG: DMT family transporter [Planctomycetes bacterium]|nr:DMT family transporter [Planctomycetota bacterium]